MVYEKRWTRTTVKLTAAHNAKANANVSNVSSFMHDSFFHKNKAVIV